VVYKHVPGHGFGIYIYIAIEKNCICFIVFKKLKKIGSFHYLEGLKGCYGFVIELVLN